MKLRTVMLWLFALAGSGCQSATDPLPPFTRVYGGVFATATSRVSPGARGGDEVVVTMTLRNTSNSPVFLVLSGVRPFLVRLYPSGSSVKAPTFTSPEPIAAVARSVYLAQRGEDSLMDSIPVPWLRTNGVGAGQYRVTVELTGDRPRPVIAAGEIVLP